MQNSFLALMYLFDGTFVLDENKIVPLILVLDVSLRSFDWTPLKITLRHFFASQKPL